MKSLEAIIKANKEVEPGYHNPLGYREARWEDLENTVSLMVLGTELATAAPKGRTRRMRKVVKGRCLYCGLEPKSFKLCRDPLCIHEGE